MASDLAEIQSKFGGTWDLDRSENFDAFLTEIGESSLTQEIRFILLIEFVYMKYR